MSTQNSGHPPISFSITTPFRNVRLLELPNDLADILTSSTTIPDERRPILKFKSAPPPSLSDRQTASTSTLTSTSTAKESILHLCSDTKSWTVKQVSTSNSVYVIQPSCSTSRNDVRDSNDGDHENLNDDVEMTDPNDSFTTPPSATVTATSQVSNFLELHPVPIDEISITQSIIDLLPTYHPISSSTSEDPNLDLQASNERKPPRSLKSLIDDIPAPDQMVKKCISKLCVFESESESTTTTDSNGVSTKKCQIPSLRTLLSIWTEIVQICAIEEIKLDSDMNVSRIISVLRDTAGSGSDDIDIDTKTKLEIVKSILKPQGLFDVLNLYSSTLSGSRLKPVETTKFIALLILACSISTLNEDETEKQTERGMALDTFLTKWTDLVPASFVKYCTLESLLTYDRDSEKVVVVTEDKDEDGSRGRVIYWNHNNNTSDKVMLMSDLIPDLSVMVSEDIEGKGNEVVVETEKKASVTTTAAAVTGDKKRKWHEKFGRQRNGKK